MNFIRYQLKSFGLGLVCFPDSHIDVLLYRASGTLVLKGLGCFCGLSSSTCQSATFGLLSKANLLSLQHQHVAILASLKAMMWSFHYSSSTIRTRNSKCLNVSWVCIGGFIFAGQGFKVMC